MRSSTTAVTGAEEACESHRARPVTVGMGTGAGAGMRLRPPGSGAGGGCGRENPCRPWNGWLETLDLHAPALRSSATSTTLHLPPSSRRAAFFQLLRRSGLPFVLCANLSSAAPRPHCACPLPWSRSLDEEPGASFTPLPFRRREYQSISISAFSPARGPATRNPLASAAAAFLPRGTAPSAGRDFSLLVSL
ncbi:hypothetical protein B0H14DRAFT_1535941 [Mycena olivaceomarginata]|nr:hypothetical protein B0H14DRAFT_1535941 [Mycena olivaceomarginata]